jgi:hypothetical protein
MTMQKSTKHTLAAAFAGAVLHTGFATGVAAGLTDSQTPGSAGLASFFIAATTGAAAYKGTSYVLSYPDGKHTAGTWNLSALAGVIGYAAGAVIGFGLGR